MPTIIQLYTSIPPCYGPSKTTLLDPTAEAVRVVDQVCLVMVRHGGGLVRHGGLYLNGSLWLIMVNEASDKVEIDHLYPFILV